MLMKETTFYTLKEVAEKLRISERSVALLITKEKKLKAFKVAGEYRIRPQDFNDFVEREIQRNQ